MWTRPTAGRRGGRGQHHHRGRGFAGSARPDESDIGCTAGDPNNNLLPWTDGEYLPALGDAAAAASRRNMTLPAWQRTPLRKCAIVVDRHVHKNGGSTVRDLFLEHERLGLALYQGYTQMYWNRDYRLLRRAGEVALRQGKRAPEHVILMEAHFGWVELAQQVPVATPALLPSGPPSTATAGQLLRSPPYLHGPLRHAHRRRARHSPQVLPSLQELSRMYQSSGVDCPLVLMTRVREPLDYYLSFYRWGVAFRQRQDPQNFGKNFIECAQSMQPSPCCTPRGSARRRAARARTQRTLARAAPCGRGWCRRRPTVTPPRRQLRARRLIATPAIRAAQVGGARSQSAEHDDGPIDGRDGRRVPCEPVQGALPPQPRDRTDR